MKRNALGILFWLALSLFPGLAAAQDDAQSIASPAGTWQGAWISQSGFLYVAKMRIQTVSDGKFEGQIDWTLRKSPRPEEQTKLGMTGIEFVRGAYDPVSRVLSFEGYAKTDPDLILGLDKYRLLLAENGKALGGLTWNNGSWQGQFIATRSPPN